MTAAKTGTVYALVDPRDNSVRYIGASTQTLQARLNGHLKSKSPRVKAWVDELAVQGLKPRIEPITEGVPKDELADLERAEITRRLVAGEQLLNESATAQGRRGLARKCEMDRIERERAAWEYAANQVRAAVGGPLAPGRIPRIQLGSYFNDAHEALAWTEDQPEGDDRRSPDRRQSKKLRVLTATYEARETFWRGLSPGWGRLQTNAGEQFKTMLEARACAVLGERWSDTRDAADYVALVPWSLVAVAPWASLAERAGLDTSGRAFIEWVADDDKVRHPLEILLLRSGERLGPLAILYEADWFVRPSTALLAMTAAHAPSFDLPDELHPEVRGFLEWMLRCRQLTQPMADLLLRLEPRALEKTLGLDIAPDIDSQLALTPGTTSRVLAAVLERTGRNGRTGELERIADRAQARLPTIDAPNFAGSPTTAPAMYQAIVASLAKAELLTATPGGKSPDELVTEVRNLWSARVDWLKRAA